MAKKVSKYKKQQQQQQLMLIGGGVVVTILLLAAVFFLIQRGTETEVCNYEDDECYGVYTTNDIEFGIRDEDGTPYIGSSDAPIIIAEFSDFGCPACLTFHPTLVSLVEEFGHTGQAQFEYRPLTFVAGRNSQVAAEAAVCAAEQGAFWQFHDELFELQDAQSASAFTTDAMKDLANDMELDADTLEDCMNSNRPGITLRAAQSLQAQLEIGGTPAIAYSLDGGESWTLLPERSPENIRALIDDANANNQNTNDNTGNSDDADDDNINENTDDSAEEN